MATLIPKLKGQISEVLTAIYSEISYALFVFGCNTDSVPQFYAMVVISKHYLQLESMYGLKKPNTTCAATLKIICTMQILHYPTASFGC